jgi:SAM-dependent methyltransferase
VLALELLCYVGDPAAAMAELARVCRPGGVVALSVENKPGAALGSGMSLEQLESLAKSDVLHEPGLSYTRYFTRGDAAALAGRAGLVVERVEGCHFMADGPFRAVAAESALAEPRKRARCHAAERLCRESDLLSNLPRAWFVLARKRP